MTYFETELLFTPERSPSKTAAKNLRSAGTDSSKQDQQTELLGIVLRIGNQPLVYNLKDLCIQSGKTPPPSDQDHYLVVHAISAMRTEGRARVDELQYFAKATDPEGLQTVGLVPKTHFNEMIRADLSLSGSLDLSGQVSLDVASDMINKLLDNYVSLGKGTQLQLSASARFIGKFIYSVQIPIVQASGIGSDSCLWILKPDENKTPLLGDQLLIQSISVPKDTRRLSYQISGVVKADKGIFWKQREKSTPVYVIELDLDHVTPKPQA